ncbi:MAG: MBL fold metallo-hydrolase [Spirochaetales bacterium]|nr:MBL fold metallo-hydrolase [Spirochaetales bacterium]
MITQLTECVFAIDVPLPGNPLRNLNSFLIKGENRNLLIDTGFNMPECHEAIMNGLSEIGVNINSTDIFLTHLHSDHVGLAPAIASPESKIFMSRVDFELFSRFTDPNYFKEVDDIFLSLGLSKEELMDNKSVNPAMIYLPSTSAEYETIEDGRIFDLGTCRLECILTPGHTPGHMCLYDPDNKILFSGDHVLFGISPNITSWINMTDSLGAYLDSLKKIRELDVERTFSSHRTIEGDLKKRVDELLAHHHERLNEAEKSVKQRKSATVYEIASDMTWSIRAKDWESFPVAQKWFAIGEAHSHLEYLKTREVLKSEIKDGLIYYMPA